MAKIGPKEAANRARREALATRTVRSKPAKAPKVRKPDKARPKPTVEVRRRKAGPATPPPVRIGRPPTGFDRKAYQRVYCANRKLYGPIKEWPADALAALNEVRSPRP
jgi:hypothetical protein